MTRRTRRTRKTRLTSSPSAEARHRYHSRPESRGYRSPRAQSRLPQACKVAEVTTSKTGKHGAKARRVFEAPLPFET